MGIYRKLPVDVEAIQYTGANCGEMQLFCGTFLDGEETKEVFNSVWTYLVPGEHSAEVWDKLHSSWIKVEPGQWIIRGVEGEYYPCAAGVFARTYINVEDVEVPETDEYHDEDTLIKVRQAIQRTSLSDNFRLTPGEVNEIINELQNAGILFRERK